MKKLLALMCSAVLTICICACDDKPDGMPQQFYDTACAFVETIDGVLTGEISRKEACEKIEVQRGVFEVYSDKEIDYSEYSEDTIYLITVAPSSALHAKALCSPVGELDKDEIEELMEIRDSFSDRLNLS